MYDIIFLCKLLIDPWYSMNMEDLNQAIGIAGTHLPIAAFNAAETYYIGRHGSAPGNGSFQFAEKTSNLAMIRYSEGEMAFLKAIQRINKRIVDLKRE